jgi:hypothetical protein
MDTGEEDLKRPLTALFHDYQNYHNRLDYNNGDAQDQRPLPPLNDFNPFILRKFIDKFNTGKDGNVFEKIKQICSDTNQSITSRYNLVYEMFTTYSKLRYHDLIFTRKHNYSRVKNDPFYQFPSKDYITNQIAFKNKFLKYRDVNIHKHILHSYVMLGYELKYLFHYPVLNCSRFYLTWFLFEVYLKSVFLMYLCSRCDFRFKYIKIVYDYIHAMVDSIVDIIKYLNLHSNKDLLSNTLMQVVYSKIQFTSLSVNVSGAENVDDNDVESPILPIPTTLGPFYRSTVKTRLELTIDDDNNKLVLYNPNNILLAVFSMYAMPVIRDPNEEQEEDLVYSSPNSVVTYSSPFGNMFQTPIAPPPLRRSPRVKNLLTTPSPSSFETPPRRRINRSPMYINTPPLLPDVGYQSPGLVEITQSKSTTTPKAAKSTSFQEILSPPSVQAPRLNEVEESLRPSVTRKVAILNRALSSINTFIAFYQKEEIKPHNVQNLGDIIQQRALQNQVNLERETLKKVLEQLDQDLDEEDELDMSIQLEYLNLLINKIDIAAPQIEKYYKKKKINSLQLERINRFINVFTDQVVPQLEERQNKKKNPESEVELFGLEQKPTSLVSSFFQ